MMMVLLLRIAAWLDRGHLSISGSQLPLEAPTCAASREAPVLQYRMVFMHYYCLLYLSVAGAEVGMAIA